MRGWAFISECPECIAPVPQPTLLEALEKAEGTHLVRLLSTGEIVWQALDMLRALRVLITRELVDKSPLLEECFSKIQQHNVQSSITDAQYALKRSHQEPDWLAFMVRCVAGITTCYEYPLGPTWGARQRVLIKELEGKLLRAVKDARK